MQDSTSNSKPKSLILVVVLLLIGLVAAFFIYKVASDRSGSAGTGVSGKSDYIIPGVPYYGIYNKKGQGARLGGDTATAVGIILEYWNPGKNNFVEITRSLSGGGGHLITAETVIDYVSNRTSDEYTVKEKRLDIDGIKEYVNQKSKTPLFLFYPVYKDQPDKIKYHPATVLIGIKDSERKLVFHDFWFGNNYEVSFDDYQKSWQSMREDERYEFLVIQPKDLNKKIKEINSREASPYLQRTTSMKNNEAIFREYVLGVGSWNSLLYGDCIDYMKKASQMASYEGNFPQYFKVRLNQYIAESNLKLGNAQEALIYAQKAVDLNKDINLPSGDWPGYEITVNAPSMDDRISEPHRVLGDAYYQVKEYQKAVESYDTALMILPSNALALQGKQLAAAALLKSVSDTK